MNEPNRLLALLFMGLLMFAVCFMATSARAQCPGGVCPLPKVVKGEVSVIASRTIQPIRCPREVTYTPKCHRGHRCHVKRTHSGVVRRVIRGLGR